MQFWLVAVFGITLLTAFWSMYLVASGVHTLWKTVRPSVLGSAVNTCVPLGGLLLGKISPEPGASTLSVLSPLLLFIGTPVLLAFYWFVFRRRTPVEP